MKKDKAKYQDLLDKRIVALKLVRGEMTPQALKAYLKNVPDASDDAVEIVVEPVKRRKKS
ncbi:MAG TPA: hypothetical protein PLR20_04245 [Syntrophales bacterium]|nr:hypothetical protein [Syntrophales bacterium]HOX93871.1 hypothetical protein [Syntrophales bacterium]HPI56421.1 hypothetical protein [Syntrophales bacterium]HPN24191.1 hypothetical protein [Syntrophales bacterium]HQM28544.1 hypothetical protein [Syntrophales bacterium]